MTKQLLIVDNEDQSDAIDKINSIVKNKPFSINCLQFNVGLPDGNDVISADGRIDMELVRKKYEKEFGFRRFHLIAFDFKLNDPNVDGVTIIKQFNAIGKTRKAKKILYSSELSEIVQDYLDGFRVNIDYEDTWSKFKTLINIEILDFCKKEDYEAKAVSLIEKISEQEDDFILEELRAHRELFFNNAIEVFQDLSFDQIADKIENHDSEAVKFKRKLIQLAIAQLAQLKNG